MNTLFKSAAVMALTALVAACSPYDKPAEVSAENFSISGRVLEVNAPDRTLVVADIDGVPFEVTAGPDVTNFNEIRQNDNVVVAYKRSVIIELEKAGEVEPGVYGVDEAGKAKPDAKPGVAEQNVVTVVSEITGIDTEKHVLTVKGANGPVQLDVKDAKHRELLAKLKVGDTVSVSFTDAMAISVQRK